MGACEIARGEKNSLELGRLDISRDWGWAPEYVEAMWRMLQLPEAEDFVISTGESNTLEEFCSVTFSELGLNWRDYVTSNKSFYRPSDITYGCGESMKAEKILGWKASIRMRDVIKKMIAHENNKGMNNLEA